MKKALFLLPVLALLAFGPIAELQARGPCGPHAGVVKAELYDIAIGDDGTRDVVGWVLLRATSRGHLVGLVALKDGAAKTEYVVSAKPIYGDNMSILRTNRRGRGVTWIRADLPDYDGESVMAVITLEDELGTRFLTSNVVVPLP